MFEDNPSLERELSPEEFYERAQLWQGIELKRYTPAVDVIDHIGHVGLLTLSGPAGVGKDTLITGTGYSRVIGVTTREPRENDGVMEQNGREYFFPGRRETLQALKTGRFVQAALVHGHFYGSMSEAYSADGEAAIDVVVQTAQELRQKPFKSVTSAYIVAPSYESWIDRLDGRGDISPEDRAKRINEAFTSLQHGLEDPDLQFVLNDDVEMATVELMHIAEYGEASKGLDKYARNLGRRMLTGIRDSLGEPATFSLA